MGGARAVLASAHIASRFRAICRRVGAPFHPQRRVHIVADERNRIHDAGNRLWWSRSVTATLRFIARHDLFGDELRDVG